MEYPEEIRFHFLALNEYQLCLKSYLIMEKRKQTPCELAKCNRKIMFFRVSGAHQTDLNVWEQKLIAPVEYQYYHTYVERWLLRYK